MSFSRFLQLIQQYYLIIIAVPIFMAGLVYYLTMGEQKTYSSSSSIYTGIASGFNVDMRQGVGDRFMIQSVFENVLTIMESKRVKEEVAVKLIAQHLIQDIDSLSVRICKTVSLQELHKLIPEDVRKELTVNKDFEKTYQRIHTYLSQDHKNVIYRIVHNKRYIPNYSLRALKSIKFKRIKTSDLVQISFSSTDPGIAMNTLSFFAEAFIKRYRFLKVSETGDIVSYFEAQLIKAQIKLDNIEQELLFYRSSNNILDYTEQVRAIAQRRQEMEGDIYKERMVLASAKYTSKYSQEQLDMHLDVLEKNTSIIVKRKRLEALASKIALVRIFDDPNTKVDLATLEQEIELLRTEMEGDLDAIFAINYSTSGVKTKDILKKWFDNILTVGESKAKLEVFEDRRNDFKNLYQTMAPIGSNLTKIEREVAVAEGAYLRILEALNLAKMRQQNIALSTKLKVVDPPLFPTTPDPSKRKLLIIIALLMGGISIVGLIILLELMDQSIRQPLRLIELTGLPLTSAFPTFPKKHGRIYYNQLRRSLSNRLIEHLDLKGTVGTKKPVFLAITSMQSTEGKTFISQELARAWTIKGKKVTIYQPKPEEGSTWNSPFNSDEKEISLSITDYNLDSLTLDTLRDKIVSETKESDYVILELPHLHSYQVPYSLWHKVDHCVLVTRANRNWGDADRQSLDDITKTLGKEPLMCLNAVKINFLKEIIGPIPQKTSKLQSILSRFNRIGSLK
jgi:succinoglycan biosynthesis transport protein ExoP